MIDWTDHVKHEEVLHKAKKERNILHTSKRKKANWVGPILLMNCLLKHYLKVKVKQSPYRSGVAQRVPAS